MYLYQIQTDLKVFENSVGNVIFISDWISIVFSSLPHLHLGLGIEWRLDFLPVDLVKVDLRNKILIAESFRKMHDL